MFIRKKPQPTRRRVQASSSSSSKSQDAAMPSSTFRRNQTLSGYRKSDDETSLRKKTHELNQLRRRIFAIFVIVATTSTLLIVLLSQYVSRAGVYPVDTNITDVSSYIATIDDYFNTNSLERFSFFLRKDTLLAHLQASHPEIERIAATSSRGLFTTETTFHLVFRTPVAVWTIADQNYYVDHHGRAFMINHHEHPQLTIIDDNHLNIRLGETAIISNRFLEFVGRLVSDLQLLELTIYQARIPIGMTRQLNVHIDGYDHLFKLAIDRSPAEQAEDIKHLIYFLNTEGLRPEYLDIRIRGRAYYRL
ncbi:hypothetical protein FWD07_00620 [Candidatus Saccharibacteria bacterium]|nr:hypothetical protein [Candidatus Saccharibacteria bacterium]